MDAVLGASHLVHVNRVPKITALGVLGESSITDTGATISATEQVVVDTGASPANSHYVARAAGLGSMGMLCEGPGAARLDFDQETIGGVLTAAYTSVGRIVKTGDLLVFRGVGGQTVGTAVVGENGLAALDFTTGDFGFGGNTGPAYPVDVLGDVNLTGVIRQSGSALIASELVRTDGSSKLTTGPLVPSDAPGYVSVDLTGQTATIATTALKPGGATALAKQYLLTGNMWMTAAGTAGTISLVISWTDTGATRTFTLPLTATALGMVSNIVFPITPNGTNDLTYAVTFSGITGTPHYSLNLLLTQREG